MFFRCGDQRGAVHVLHPLLLDVERHHLEPDQPVGTRFGGHLRGVERRVGRKKNVRRNRAGERSLLDPWARGASELFFSRYTVCCASPGVCCIDLFMYILYVCNVACASFAHHTCQTRGQCSHRYQKVVFKKTTGVKEVAQCVCSSTQNLSIHLSGILGGGGYCYFIGMHVRPSWYAPPDDWFLFRRTKILLIDFL